jgi:hypothetical protein
LRGEQVFILGSIWMLAIAGAAADPACVVKNQKMPAPEIALDNVTTIAKLAGTYGAIAEINLAP